MTISQISFQANWNSSNIHLCSNIIEIWKQSEKPFLQKCYLCFTKALDLITDLITRPAREICRMIILPISRAPQTDRQKLDYQWTHFWSRDGSFTELAVFSPWAPLRNTSPEADLRNVYEASKLNATAPDGTVVKGAFYRHQRGVGQDVPTIICFGPNAELAKSTCWNWLLKKGMNTPIPFNVVVFDYRSGIDLTKADECVLDGDTILQAVHQLGISKKHIHMIGYSFGGGIGAQVRAMHQEAGNYVNLRSFRSIGHVLKHSPVVSHIIPASLRSGWIGDVVKSILATLISSLKWGIDVSDSIRMIGHRALIVYHPQDPLIPRAASPAQLVDPSQAVEMRFKETVTENPDDFNHHVSPLASYQDTNELSISKRILNFLLGTDVFQRHSRERYCSEHAC